MTREEQIIQASEIFSTNDLLSFGGACEELDYGFREGAKWADKNPNKELVYTKKELLNMGFGFDLNGNISTPQEMEERTKKYINYRKDKWVKDACEWIKNNKHLYKVPSSEGLSTDWDEFIIGFRKAMED